METLADTVYNIELITNLTIIFIVALSVSVITGVFWIAVDLEHIYHPLAWVCSVIAVFCGMMLIFMPSQNVACIKAQIKFVDTPAIEKLCRGASK